MYVFLMPKGELVELDQKFLQKRVTALCDELNLRFNIPPDRQILLISGGTELMTSDMPSVCGAGEDRTNPIYVFLRNDAEGPLHLQPDQKQFSGVDLLSSIQGLLRSPGPATLRELSEKMLQLSQHAAEACTSIEKMIFEQRHMCEGWFIALANLTHVVDKTQARLDTYYKDYNQFCIDAVHLEKNLKRFSKIRQELSGIPLLPQLSDAASDAIGNPSMVGSVPGHFAPRNLYDWICLHCPHTPLNLVNIRSGVGGALFREGSDLCLNSLRPCTPMGSQSSLSHLPPPPPVHFSASPPTDSAAAPSVLESGLVDIVQRALNNLDCLQAGMPSRRLLQMSSSEEGAAANVMSTSASSNSENSSSEKSMQLNYVSSQLDALRDLLAAAPKDQSQHNDEGDEERDQAQEPAVQTGAFTSASSISLHASPAWPIPEFEGKASHSPTTANAASISGILESGFSRRDFSKSLALLDPMLEKACLLRDDIKEITKRLVSDWKQRSASSSRDNRDRNPRSLLREQDCLIKGVIDRFESLRGIFHDTMEKKLALAESLAAQQGNLQKFHSEINLKDSNIQRCRRIMERVTTVGVLLEQIKEAPSLYVKCLLEVVRRRTVDDAYARRYDAFVERSSEFRREEIRRRRLFAKELQYKLLGEMFGPLKEAKLTARGVESFVRRSRIPRPGSRPGRVSLASAPVVSIFSGEPISHGADLGRSAAVSAVPAVGTPVTLPTAAGDGDMAPRFPCGRSHSTSHLENQGYISSGHSIEGDAGVKPIPPTAAGAGGGVETSPRSGFRLQQMIAAAAATSGGGGGVGVSGLYRCSGSGRNSSRATILSVDEEDFQPNQLTRSNDLPSISADDLASLAEILPPELADLIAEANFNGTRSKKHSVVDHPHQQQQQRRKHSAIDSSLEFPFDREEEEEDELMEFPENTGAAGFGSRSPKRFPHSSMGLTVLHQHKSVATSTEDIFPSSPDQFSNAPDRSPNPVAQDVESVIFSPAPPSEPVTPPEELDRLESSSNGVLMPNASSNEIFLSMDGSALHSCLDLYEADRTDDQTEPCTTTSGDHLVCSFHSANSPAPSEASLVAQDSAAPLLHEALTSHSQCIRELCGHLRRILPDVGPSSPPSFTGSEDPSSYLVLSVQSLQSLVDRLSPLSPLKTPQISTADISLSTTGLQARSADAVVQATQAKRHAASECKSSDFVETGAEASEMTAEEARLMSPSEHHPVPVSSSTPTTAIPVASFLSRSEFTFSCFHANDVVIFIPVPSPPTKAAPPVEAASSTTAGAYPEATVGAALEESSSLFFKSCLDPSASALLSSAILSSAFATDSTATITPSSVTSKQPPEQWRMLSTDGHVYFLHDADFEAFGLSRLPHLPALQGSRDTVAAAGRGGQRPLSLIDPAASGGALSDARLPFSQRAFSHVAGVFLRKERCISKKDDNRFQLQKDFVFFRVRARPLTAAENEQLLSRHAGAQTPRT
ncbi:reticulophagy [Sparganum proliferum]